MIYLFIDTNVLLSFYAFTPDDLTRLDRLAQQLERGEIVVLTTPQVRDEFRRNREAKITDAMKELRSARLDFNFPRLCDPYSEIDRMRELAREYSRLHGELVEKIERETRDRVLRADEVVSRFFANATTIASGPEILDRARLRLDCGNPPGKRGSLGDAINWESLLEWAPKGQTYLVTDDSDYFSPFDKARPHEFLLGEWAAKVESEVNFVRRLSELPAAVPKDALPVDDAQDDRDRLIAALLSSGSFATTHRIIAGLGQILVFTPRQVQDLVRALENSQVCLILGDSDVYAFYEGLADRHLGALGDADARSLQEALEAYGDVASEGDSGDIPF